MSEKNNFPGKENKMKKKLFLLCALCVLCSWITGCCFMGGKNISVVDMSGQPVGDCLVVAVESNIAWNNRAGLYQTGKDGTATIPYHSQIEYFAGKEGYRISTKESAEKDVQIVLYERNKFLPMQKKAVRIKFTDQLTPSALEQLRKDPEFENWLKYSRNTLFVIEK